MVYQTAPSIVWAINMASYWYWNLLYLLSAVFVACLFPTRATENAGSLNCSPENVTSTPMARKPVAIASYNCSLENVDTALMERLPVLPDFPCLGLNLTANLNCCREETTTGPPTTTGWTSTAEATTDSTTTTPGSGPTTEAPTTTIGTSTGETTTDSTTTGSTTTNSTTTDSTTTNSTTTNSTTTDSTTTLAGPGGPSTTPSSTATASQPISSASPDHSLPFTEASSSLALTSPVHNTTTQEIKNYTTGENTTTEPPVPPSKSPPLETWQIVLIVILCVCGVGFLVFIGTFCFLKHYQHPNKVEDGAAVLTAELAQAGNGTDTDKKPLSSPHTGQQVIHTPHIPDEHTVENESGRGRTFSTGSQVGDTAVLMPKVDPAGGKPQKRKNRRSKGATELKPLRKRPSYDINSDDKETKA